MRVTKHRYQVIPGEPHLGYVNEYEIYITPDEIYEAIAKEIERSGDFPTTFEYCDDGVCIEIDTSEWIGDKMDDYDKLDELFKDGDGWKAIYEWLVEDTDENYLRKEIEW